MLKEMGTTCQILWAKKRGKKRRWENVKMQKEKGKHLP